VLTRKNDQFNLPVLATLAYELELGKNFNLRLGPSLGFTFVSIESSFYGYNQISNENDPNDPNSNGKTNEIRLKKSGSKAIFTYGATAGATWNITKRLHADFQYRLTGNEAVDFGFGRDFGKSIIQQANLSLGWRF
jgi:opacity protein-like surface antigen